VKGSIGSVQSSTKHINKTLNPKWFDASKLPVVQWRPDSTSLTIEVYDKNAVTANVIIGRCILDLNKFRDGMRHDLWLRSRMPSAGRSTSPSPTLTTRWRSSRTLWRSFRGY